MKNWSSFRCCRVNNFKTSKGLLYDSKSRNRVFLQGRWCSTFQFGDDDLEIGEATSKEINKKRIPTINKEKQPKEKKPKVPPKLKFDKSEIQLRIERLTNLNREQTQPTNSDQNPTATENPIIEEIQKEPELSVARVKRIKNKTTPSSEINPGAETPNNIAKEVNDAVNVTSEKSHSVTTRSGSKKQEKRKVHTTSEITVANHENYNEIFTTIFEKLGMYEKILGNYEKFKAYHKVIKTLRSLDHKVESGKEALKLDGIGKKIAVKIDEILATGHLKQLDDYQENPMIKVMNDIS
jgi:hypothetical protein